MQVDFIVQFRRGVELQFATDALQFFGRHLHGGEGWAEGREGGAVAVAVAVRVGCGEGWIGFDSIRVAKREEQWDEWRQKETATAVSSSRLLFRQ